MFFLVLGILINLPINEANVALNIDGLIDLGPKWNFEYKIEPIRRANDDENVANSDANDAPQFRNSLLGLMMESGETDGVNLYLIDNNTTAHALALNNRNNKKTQRHRKVKRTHVTGDDEVKVSTKKKWKRILRQPFADSEETNTVATKKKMFKKTTKQETTTTETKPRTTKIRTTKTTFKPTTHKKRKRNQTKHHGTSVEKNILDEIKKIITAKVTMINNAVDDILDESETYDMSEVTTHKMKKLTTRRHRQHKEITKKNIQRHRKGKHKIKKKKNLRNHIDTTTVKYKHKRKIEIERLSAIHDDKKKGTRFSTEDVFGTPHKVSEDINLRKVFLYIFDKSKSYLADVKHMLHDSDKVDEIITTYKKKFKAFVKETQRSNIKTKSGTKKVMLNALETSNSYLDKLINFLIVKIKERGVVYGEIEELEESLRNSLDEEINEQYKNICESFGVCRSKYDFMKFIVDLIEELLQCDDDKLKVATGSLTEAIKGTSFIFLDSESKNKLNILLDWIDNCHLTFLKTLWTTVKNTIASANKPLTLGGLSQVKVKQTVAFIDIMSILSENIPATDQNIALWKDLVSGMESYGDGRRKEVQALMNTLIIHLVTYSNEFGGDIVNNIRKRLRVALL